VRVALDADTQRHLDALTQKVTEHTSPKAEAERLWNQKASRPFDGAVDAGAMAAGRARCMYCEDDRGTDIEHFYPKATYPLRAFSWRNYLLACGHCNSNLKREQFPLDAAGQPALVDPTVDDPAAHLVFLPTTGEFRSIGSKGAPSIEVFALNDHTPPRKLPQARQKTLVKLIVILQEYDRALETAEVEYAALLKETVRDEPFPAVLGWLLRVAQGPNAALVLAKTPDLPGILQRHGVADW
jgi:uncharacterized protein (TIGR02646 family)